MASTHLLEIVKFLSKIQTANNLKLIIHVLSVLLDFTLDLLGHACQLIHYVNNTAQSQEPAQPVILVIELRIILA